MLQWLLRCSDRFPLRCLIFNAWVGGTQLPRACGGTEAGLWVSTYRQAASEANPAEMWCLWGDLPRWGWPATWGGWMETDQTKTQRHGQVVCLHTAPRKHFTYGSCSHDSEQCYFGVKFGVHVKCGPFLHFLWQRYTDFPLSDMLIMCTAIIAALFNFNTSCMLKSRLELI